MQLTHTASAAVMVIAVAAGLVLTAEGVGSAQDQKQPAPIVSARSGGLTYQAQLDRVRSAIETGDQAQVNGEFAALFGILQTAPMSAPADVQQDDATLSEETMQVIRYQDERAGTAF